MRTLGLVLIAPVMLVFLAVMARAAQRNVERTGRRHPI